LSEFLVLIPGENPAAQIVWARVSADGTVVAQGAAHQTPPPAMPPQRTILVLPGAEARLKRLELPARTEAQARAGAPFLFEGVLADDQDTHFAVGDAQDAAGLRLVAAISSQRLQAWLERCRTLGADPHLVVLDCAIWPVAPDEVVIASFPNRVIVAAGAAGGFSIEPALAPPVFAQWLRDTVIAPTRVTLLGGDETTWRAALGQYANALDVGAGVDPVLMLAKGAVEAASTIPNLRQGEFAVASRRAAPLKLWRFAALSGIRDQQAAAQIMQMAERDFGEANPNTRVVNLRAQVAALTNQMEQSARHPVLAVSEPIVAALRQQPLVRIDDVRHQAPGRSVRVQLSAPDAASLEAVAATLRGNGLTLDSHDLPLRDGRFVLELAVEAPQ
jgi:type II secretion system protein L